MVTGRGEVPVRVSVAMVSYNGEKYLKEQIESVLQQLGPEDELVVSDDGSTDRTLEILEEYQNRDARVRLLQGPGRGIKKNVEHVLRHAMKERLKSLKGKQCLPVRIIAMVWVTVCQSARLMRSALRRGKRPLMTRLL